MLIHAGMMMAVFTLAELAGGIAYVVIVIFGNALVMCMEALLVAIQVLRLNFMKCSAGITTATDAFQAAGCDGGRQGVYRQITATAFCFPCGWNAAKT